MDPQRNYRRRVLQICSILAQIMRMLRFPEFRPEFRQSVSRKLRMLRILINGMATIVYPPPPPVPSFV